MFQGLTTPVQSCYFFGTPGTETVNHYDTKFAADTFSGQLKNLQEATISDKSIKVSMNVFG